MRRVTGVAVLALLTACAPDRIEITPLAEGEWMVLDATSSSAVLLQMGSTARASARGGARSGGPVIQVLRDTLEPATTQALSARVGANTLQLTRVQTGDGDFYFNPAGTPRLIRSPAQSHLYAFEHEDAIWVWKASDSTMNKLSLDDGLPALRARQREGEVILYWTADPMWTGDGAFISYHTNRTGVATSTATQGIRVIQTGTGVEKTIYDSIGTSVHIDGVHGEELVFSSSSAPGVFAVHPRTAATRAVAPGYVMGSHPGGRGLVVNQNGQLSVITSEGIDSLPAPSSQFVYTSHAHFSPSGKRVAVFSTDERGTYALHVYDIERERMFTAAIAGGPSYGPVWASDATVIFAAARPSSPLLTYRADMR